MLWFEYVCVKYHFCGWLGCRQFIIVVGVLGEIENVKLFVTRGFDGWKFLG